MIRFKCIPLPQKIKILVYICQKHIDAKHPFYCPWSYLIDCRGQLAFEIGRSLIAKTEYP